MCAYLTSFLDSKPAGIQISTAKYSCSGTCTPNKLVVHSPLSTPRQQMTEDDYAVMDYNNVLKTEIHSPT